MNNSNTYNQLSLAVRTANIQEIKEFVNKGGNIIPYINDLVRVAITSNNIMFLNFLGEKGYLKSVNIDRALFFSAKMDNTNAFNFFSQIETPSFSLISTIKNSNESIKRSFTELTGHNF